MKHGARCIGISRLASLSYSLQFWGFTWQVRRNVISLLGKKCVPYNAETCYFLPVSRWGVLVVFVQCADLGTSDIVIIMFISSPASYRI